ncbi:hypothetical protein ACHAWF_013994 [Thalassiosira exigua]
MPESIAKHHDADRPSRPPPLVSRGLGRRVPNPAARIRDLRALPRGRRPRTSPPIDPRHRRVRRRRGRIVAVDDDREDDEEGGRQQGHGLPAEGRAGRRRGEHGLRQRDGVGRESLGGDQVELPRGRVQEREEVQSGLRPVHRLRDHRRHVRPVPLHQLRLPVAGRHRPRHGGNVEREPQPGDHRRPAGERAARERLVGERRGIRPNGHGLVARPERGSVRGRDGVRRGGAGGLLRRVGRKGAIQRAPENARMPASKILLPSHVLHSAGRVVDRTVAVGCVRGIWSRTGRNSVRPHIASTGSCFHRRSERCDPRCQQHWLL